MPILAPLQGWRQVLASVTHFRRSAVPGSRSTGPELEPISQNWAARRLSRICIFSRPGSLRSTATPEELAGTDPNRIY